MSDTQNPLSGFMIDLGKVDTSRAVPASGTYIASFGGMEIKPSSKDAKKSVAHVKFALTNPCESAPNSQGKTVTLPAGYIVMDYYTMWDVEGMSTAWQVRFAKLYDAIVGTDDATRPDNIDFAPLVGQTLVLTIDTKFDEKIDGLSARVKKVAKHNQ